MSMTKRVNVQAKVAIRTTKPPIYGNIKNVIMTTSDILKCICMRAIVEEILPDGSTVRLNMKNYFIDNGAGLDARKTAVAVKKEADKAPEVVTDPIITTDVTASKEETTVDNENLENNDADVTTDGDTTATDDNTEEENAETPKDDNPTILVTESADDNGSSEGSESADVIPAEVVASNEENAEASSTDEVVADTVVNDDAAIKEENKETKPAAKPNTAKKNTQSKKNSNKKKN